MTQIVGISLFFSPQDLLTSMLSWHPNAPVTLTTAKAHEVSAA